MARPTVWVVTPELHRLGGTERALAEQIERWAGRFDLTIYAMRIQGVSLDGIRVRKIAWLPGPQILRYIWWFVANHMVRAIDQRRYGHPDNVHSPGVNCFDAKVMGVYVVFAEYWRATGAAILHDLRSLRTLPRAVHRILYFRLVKALERRVYEGPATIWAISNQDARALETSFSRPHGSVPVVPLAVDHSNFSPVRVGAVRDSLRTRYGLDGKTVLLLVGNDVHRKGIDIAIGALHELPDDVVLALRGTIDGAFVEQQPVQLRRRILLLPKLPNAIDSYALADIVLVPSREDSFALPAIEGLACGIPVIVSAYAGAVELVQDGLQALVLKNPEDVSELTFLIKRILGDSRLANTLSREGHRLSRDFVWDRNAEVAAGLIEKEIFTPRVLVLAPDIDGPGGIERTSRSCITAFAERYGPERVGLLTLGKPPGGLACRVLSSRKSPGGRIGTLAKLRFIWDALRAARRWKKNLVLVVAHPHLAPVAALASRITGAPFVVWCYGNESWGPIRPSVKASLKRASVVIAPSQFTAHRLEDVARLRSGRVRVLHLGLDPKTLAPESPPAAKPNEPILIVVGRLKREDAYKGIDSLLHVWPRTLERVPGARLWVVGDGTDSARLQAIANNLMLDGRVKFFGRVSDEELARLYRSASVFGLPARFQLGPKPEGEGFGLVYIEAGAAGLPVIGARGGGVEDAIEHGRTGLLVDSEDPGELEDAIVRLLTDEVLARRMGEEGRRRAQSEFSYEAFSARICGVVDEIFAQRRSERPLSRCAA